MTDDLRRRAADNKGRVEKLIESPTLTFTYRGVMGVMMAVLVFFVRQAYDELRDGQHQQQASINQVVIGQAVAVAEREDVTRRLVRVEDSIKSIWDTLRGKVQ